MAKRLYRSRNDRVIAGICGGLGEYFDIDPTIFRIIFVVAVVAGGVSALLYILGMIVIPEEPAVTTSKNEHSKPEDHTPKTVENSVKKSGRSDSSATGGVILILVGVLFLLNNLLNINVWGNFWPLILVVVGLSIMAKSFNTRD